MSKNPYESPNESGHSGGHSGGQQGKLPFRRRRSKLGAAAVGFAGGVLIPIAFSCYGLYVRYSFMNDQSPPKRYAHYDYEFELSYAGLLFGGLICGTFGALIGITAAFFVDRAADRSSRRREGDSTLRSEGDAETLK